MATRTEAPYQQSRSALRKIFGSRSINGSAPQSAMDSTPSGIAARRDGSMDDTPSARQARLRESGLRPREVKAEENARWRTLFPAPEMAPIQPMQRFAARPPSSTLDAILQANANGAVSGTFPVPQYGGSVGFSRPSPIPSMAVADPSDLGGYATKTTSPLSFFRPKQRPSILTGAQQWMAQI